MTLSEHIKEAMKACEKDVFDSFQRELGYWQDRTFPKSTSDSVFHHLVDEVLELGKKPYDPEELADVGLLLFGLANKEGVSLLEVMREKFEKNRARTWGEPDERGVVRHVKEGSHE